MDNPIIWQVLFNQFEGRTNGPDNEFRWDGQGWTRHRHEQALSASPKDSTRTAKLLDGDTEALYDRPIPFLRYFDAQAGVRYDLDSNPGRTLGSAWEFRAWRHTFSISGADLYFSDRGRCVAGRVTGSYDLLFTNRLILQPAIRC